jgi:hypothetical protein
MTKTLARVDASYVPNAEEPGELLFFPWSHVSESQRNNKWPPVGFCDLLEFRQFRFKFLNWVSWEFKSLDASGFLVPDLGAGGSTGSVPAAFAQDDYYE